jgi:hypothetical protein
VRDPHLLVFDQKLFVYSGAWLVDPADPRSMDMNDHLGFCAWSEDGVNWHGPRMLEGTHGFYIWRAAAHGDMAYLNGRRVHNYASIPDSATQAEQTESWLLQSRDGFNWLPAGLIQPHFGDETALLFEADGSPAPDVVRRKSAGQSHPMRSGRELTWIVMSVVRCLPSGAKTIW